MRKRERDSVHVQVTVNMGKKEREGERNTERLHPKQKRVKWVRVADER